MLGARTCTSPHVPAAGGAWQPGHSQAWWQQLGLQRAALHWCVCAQVYSESKLFLYGGVSATGAALNDAWVYDVQERSWECVFYGHSSLVLPTGSVGTLMQACSCVCMLCFCVCVWVCVCAWVCG